MLTKTAYLDFLRCPREFWLANHEPTQRDLTLEEQHRIRAGYEVQAIAQQMSVFQTGIVSFQAVFSTDQFEFKADIVITDDAGEISIYEVKSGASVKDEYLADVAFQVMVANAAGYRVSRAYVITIDTSYARNGAIDPDRLLKITDVTEEVTALQDETKRLALEAISYLATEPIPNLAEYCDSKLDCGFIRRHFPDIPDYNVTNISRLDKKKLATLLTQGIVDIQLVPEDFQLTDRQRRQVELAKSGEVFIDRAAIGSELSGLKYPLNFLDYETFGYAIPHFEGIRPYQQMLFQYSLHTIEHEGAELTHSFHVSRATGSHPAHELLESLQRDLAGRVGSVVVWHESFEKGRNIQGGDLFPEFADFLTEVNAAIFDLKTIFSKGNYVHPGFRGSASIKRVLPVLCPDLSYGDLEIGDGITASIKWYQMVSRGHDEKEREQIFEALCAYCHLDTLAMVRIYEHLRSL